MYVNLVITASRVVLWAMWQAVRIRHSRSAASQCYARTTHAMSASKKEIRC